MRSLVVLHHRFHLRHRRGCRRRNHHHPAVSTAATADYLLLISVERPELRSVSRGQEPIVVGCSSSWWRSSTRRRGIRREWRRLLLLSPTWWLPVTTTPSVVYMPHVGFVGDLKRRRRISLPPYRSPFNRLKSASAPTATGGGPPRVSRQTPRGGRGPALPCRRRHPTRVTRKVRLVLILVHGFEEHNFVRRPSSLSSLSLPSMTMFDTPPSSSSSSSFNRHR